MLSCRWTIAVALVLGAALGALLELASALLGVEG